MYVLILVFLIFGLLFHSIAAPISEFLIHYQWVIFVITMALLAVLSFSFGKLHRSIVCGLGFFAAKSQLWLIVLEAIIEIASIIKESDPFGGALSALIVGGLLSAYALFNSKMVNAAVEAADEHPAYSWIVATVGWGILFVLILLG